MSWRRGSLPASAASATAAGFVVDEETHVAAHCRCRAAGVVERRRAREPQRRDPAQVPRRVVRPPAGDRDRRAASSRAVRALRRATSTSSLDAGRGLWFFGSVGTGKTTLAMLVSRARARRRPHASRSTRCRGCWPRSARRSTTTASGSYVDLLDRLTAVDLLHIDDVGAEKTSPWVLEQLYAIVNARYEDERSIVITTNLERDELAEQISERTVSRLEEMCEVLPLCGADGAAAQRRSA